MESLENLITRLPKAELHLHIEGTLEPELMFMLAERNKVALKFPSVTALREAYQFSELQDFLNLYYAGTSVLVTGQDFYDLTWNYLLRAKEDNIVHTEIMFDPQAHTLRGIPFGVVIEGINRALTDGREQLGISSRLIMSFLRHLSEEMAFDTLNESLPYREMITAVGLDSSERNNPPSKFQNVFAKARDYGYLTVAHAGEEGPPEYVWEALQILNVSRVDHGNSSLLDPALINYLAERKMPLTLCPLSNLRLKVVKNLSAHPLKAMLEKDLPVTVNSDDPAYFGGYLNDNYLAIAKSLLLDNKQIIQLVRNSFLASFLTESSRQSFLSLIPGA